MNFSDFADKWIKENVSDDFYSDMSNSLREFVALIVRQRHSGASIGLFMSYVFQLRKVRK